MFDKVGSFHSCHACEGPAPATDTLMADWTKSASGDPIYVPWEVVYWEHEIRSRRLQFVLVELKTTIEVLFLLFCRPVRELVMTDC